MKFSAATAAVAALGFASTISGAAVLKKRADDPIVVKVRDTIVVHVRHEPI